MRFLSRVGGAERELPASASYKFTCSSVFPLLGTHGPRIPTAFSSIAEPKRPVRLGQGWQDSAEGLASVTGRVRETTGTRAVLGWGFPWGSRGPVPQLPG